MEQRAPKRGCQEKWGQGMRVLAVESLLLFLSSLQYLLHTDGDLHPLIFIPGHEGSQLEARLTNTYEPMIPICGAQRGRGWFRLWLNFSMVLDPLEQPCFAEQMSLLYDHDADDYRNVPGVKTRVPYFGSTRGFIYIDPDHKDKSPNMVILVKQLEQMGYREGVNLFGAPYDFRYGLAVEGHPCQVGSQFLNDLKQLVEKASKLNEGKPVIILTHSYGGLFALNLLNRNRLNWRQKFIKHFITLSAPWGGFIPQLLFFAYGNGLGFHFIDPKMLRHESRTLESDLWMLPSPKVFGNMTIVITKDRNYSAFDMTDFLYRIGYAEGIEPYRTRILPLIEQLPAPGVPITCMTGFGVPTPEKLVYRGSGFDEMPEIIHGDGDGLVNLVSLLAVESDWTGMPQQYVKVIKMPNVSHSSILEEELPLREIIRVLYDVNSIVLTSIP